MLAMEAVFQGFLVYLTQALISNWLANSYFSVTKTVRACVQKLHNGLCKVWRRQYTHGLHVETDVCVLSSHY